MLLGLIVLLPLHIVLYLFGGELAIRGGEGDDLVTGRLDGAGLMAVDVTGHSTYHALPRTQKRGDHGGVGLRAANEEVDVGLGRVAGSAHLSTGTVADLVAAVTHGLHHVGLHHALHNGAVGTLQIVAVKIDHTVLLPNLNDTRYILLYFHLLVKGNF